MRKKLCCLLSIALALCICLPQGAFLAAASGIADSIPTKTETANTTSNQTPDAPNTSGTDVKDTGTIDSSQNGDLVTTVPDSGSDASGEKPQPDPSPPSTDESSPPSTQPPSNDVQPTSPDIESGQVELRGTEPEHVPRDVSEYFHANVYPGGIDNPPKYKDGDNVKIHVLWSNDHCVATEDDYIYITIPHNLKNVTFDLNSHIFKDPVDMGNGKYKVPFTREIRYGWTGGFFFYAEGYNPTDTAITAPVTVAKSSANVTIYPGDHNPSTPEIVKWAGRGDGYLQTSDSTGEYDPDRDVRITYAISVDPKMARLHNAVVTDTLPAGMSVDPASIRIVPIDNDSHFGPDLPEDEVQQIVYISGNQLVFSFGNRLDGTKQYRIYYDVVVEAGTTATLTNTATIHHEGGCEKSSSFTITPEHEPTTLTTNKIVDRDVVSNDPEDQTVTYTIEIKNDHALHVGELHVSDALDERIHYKGAQGSDALEITYDEVEHEVRITNNKEIPANSTQTVMISTDFSDAPAGSEVHNTVGDSTVTTKKVAGEMSVAGQKIVDEEVPGDRQFIFELVDSDGNVIQTQVNGENGQIQFDPMKFGPGDIGNEYTFKVRESETQNLTGYILDSTEYIVSVTPRDEDNDGIIECFPRITTEDGELASMVLFENFSEEEGPGDGEEGEEPGDGEDPDPGDGPGDGEEPGDGPGDGEEGEEPGNGNEPGDGNNPDDGPENGDNPGGTTPGEGDSMTTPPTVDSGTNIPQDIQAKLSGDMEHSDQMNTDGGMDPQSSDQQTQTSLSQTNDATRPFVLIGLAAVAVVAIAVAVGAWQKRK